jgi:hypothetical protein
MAFEGAFLQVRRHKSFILVIPIYNEVGVVKAHDDEDVLAPCFWFSFCPRVLVFDCGFGLRNQHRGPVLSESLGGGTLAPPSIYSVTTATMILHFELPARGGGLPTQPGGILTLPTE